MSKRGQKHSIQLTIRVRPAACSTIPRAVTVDTSSGNVMVGRSTFSYANNVVCGSDQLLCHEAISSNLLSKIRQGYSCAIMAYGETGSGKTHTMFGPPGALSKASITNVQKVPDNWGVFPRTAIDLLSIPQISLAASAIEIYQNQPYDLFNRRKKLQMPGKRRKPAKAYKHHDLYCNCDLCTKMKAKNEAAEAFATRGTTRVELQTPTDIAKFCQQIELTRTAKSHQLNERSSRSHCLVQMHLRISLGDSFLQPTFMFIDLAGSERVRKSGTVGEASKEAFGINSSLTTLGRVIQLIGRKEKYIPYRDSTLTMLLKPLFGGSSCTSVVVTTASEMNHEEETISALRFGQRMTFVENTETIVQGQSSAHEKKAIEKELIQVRQKLKVLEERGQGGRFGTEADTSAKATFLSHLETFEKVQATMERSKIRLAEAKAKGFYPAEEISHLEVCVEQNMFAFQNIHDIVEREKSIRGLWFPPSASYQKYTMHAKDLENQLAFL